MLSVHFTRSYGVNLIPFAFPALLLLNILKDLLDSSVNGYAFYLSESMLFGSFWPLFVPLLVLQRRLLLDGLGRYLLPILFSAAHLLLFAFLVSAISYFFYPQTFQFRWVLVDSFFDLGFACFFTYGVVSTLFKPSSSIKPTIERPGKIRVNHIGRTVMLSCDSICFVRTDRPYIALITMDRTYLHSSSLKSFMKEHLPANFIRIHKSTVVNTDFIRSYTSRKNGDYDVLMATGDTLRVSRNYSDLFRSAPKASA